MPWSRHKECPGSKAVAARWPGATQPMLDQNAAPGRPIACVGGLARRGPWDRATVSEAGQSKSLARNRKKHGLCSD